MSEATITASIRRELTKMARAGDLFFMKIHGGPVQRPGVPDWFILWRGVSIFLEVKVRGNKPTPIQEHTMKLIRQAGGISGVVHSLEEFRGVMEEIARRPSHPQIAPSP